MLLGAHWLFHKLTKYVNTNGQSIWRSLRMTNPTILFFFFNLFIYLSCGSAGYLLLLLRLTLVMVSRGYSLLWCEDFSLWWLLLLWSTDSVAVVHRLNCSKACGIFQTRDGTHVSCIGRQILIHLATRKVLIPPFFSAFLSSCILSELPSHVRSFNDQSQGNWRGIGISTCKKGTAQHPNPPREDRHITPNSHSIIRIETHNSCEVPNTVMR